MCHDPIDFEGEKMLEGSVPSVMFVWVSVSDSAHAELYTYSTGGTL